MKKQFVHFNGIKNSLFFSYSYLSIVLFLLFFLPSCTQKKQPATFSNKDLAKVISTMTNIMLQDITNPPLAARFFSYTCLAGYEVVAQYDATFKPMYGKLNGYPKMKMPTVAHPYSNQLSALLAMMETAKKIQPSGAMMDLFEKNF